MKTWHEMILKEREGLVIDWEETLDNCPRVALARASYSELNNKGRISGASRRVLVALILSMGGKIVLLEDSQCRFERIKKQLKPVT